jgi:CO/xanthine dehydrogenase FAD-binding subunit
MLARIAGAHVRQAGTLGGNLVLARSKGLESDLATALLGWGATGGCAALPGRRLFSQRSSTADSPAQRVHCAELHVKLPPCALPAVLLLDTTQVQGGAQAADGHSIHVDGLPHCAEVALEVFLSGDRRLEPGQLLVAARLPLLAPEDYFWCSKVGCPRRACETAALMQPRLQSPPTPARP